MRQVFPGDGDFPDKDLVPAGIVDRNCSKHQDKHDGGVTVGVIKIPDRDVKIEIEEEQARCEKDHAEIPVPEFLVGPDDLSNRHQYREGPAEEYEEIKYIEWYRVHGHVPH